MSPKIPVASVNELLAYAKARPRQLNYGSSGSGNSGHLAMELLKMMTDIDVVHVPYKGTAQAQTALLSGQELQLMFASPASVLPHVKAGRLKALGVAPLGGTAAQADKHIRAEIVKWPRVVKQSGASVD